jgi:hypothetical protein
MRFSHITVFALLGMAAFAVGARSDDAPPPAVRDDAQLFQPNAAAQASEELKDIGELYGLPFVLETVASAEDVKDQLRDAKTSLQKDQVLRDWAAKRAKEADDKAVYILICKDVTHGWFGRVYGAVVVVVPDEARSRQFTDADAKALHDQLRWFNAGKARAKNDAILLSAVDRLRDMLAYNHRPPFPWFGVGGVMGVVLGLWGLLGLVRLRMRRADAASGPPETRRPDLFAALLGSMFGSVSAHWVYDTLFVAASRAPAVEEALPAVDEKQPAAPVEAAAPREPTQSERLDLAASERPASEPARF